MHSVEGTEGYVCADFRTALQLHEITFTCVLCTCEVCPSLISHLTAYKVLENIENRTCSVDTRNTASCVDLPL